MPATADFRQTFTTRREYCRALLELSRTQMQAVDADDYGELLSIISRKQKLLGRLDELNQSHPQLWEGWRADRGAMTAEQRTLCENILDETESILAELVKQEQVTAESLTHKRNTTQRELQELSGGSATQQAYRDSLSPATHRHLDVGR